MSDDADRQASDALAKHRLVVGDRLVGAPEITWIMPGDHLEHQRVVAHRTGHRSDMVEGEGEGCHAAAADPAVNRLHAGDPAHRGRIADRAAGVGAECCREETGSEASTAAARRAAAKMIAAPRVEGRRPGQIEGWAANGEFVGRELAEEHPTSRFEPLRDHRVPSGGIAHQDLGMRRGRHTLDVDDVLQRIGHAMERPAPSTGRYLGLGRPRCGQCPFRCQCNEGVVLGVVALDAGQQCRHILDASCMPAEM